jgi:hypothetical protein
MNGMPFDMVLSQPLAETFQAGGVAPNILAAHNLAWDALNSMLGGDPAEAWALKGMQHTYYPNPTTPGVQFIAEFVRDPEFEQGAGASEE